MRRTIFAVIVLGVLFPAAPALPWGSTGHHLVAQNYSKHLPAHLDGLAAWDAVVDGHVMDPDSRKCCVPGESVRHYIDIDYYPEFWSGTLPHDRATLEAMYGPSTVSNNGVLPWAVGEVVTTLAGQMAAGLWDEAALTIADLCHYVGDGHVPLHCTLNYDGQYTGNNGIHSRWESSMINTFQGTISVPAVEASAHPDAVEAMFDIIESSWTGVTPILDADDDAKAASGGSYNALYYQTLWYYTGVLATQQIQQAAQQTARMVMTAWVLAGEPPVPGSTVAVSPGGPSSGSLTLALGPNPFRDHLTVRWNGPGTHSVEVLDARGTRVADLGTVEGAGGSVVWTPGTTAKRLAPGVYWVRVTGGGQRAVAKAVYLP